ncbi:uncharacterized protein K452DRAFT_9699 [Aplosporella prunicola CBS 121167]|uniref:Uncharacterized protein n=1 Tax=Aplosporella prunicola CBS 121167 TaxID=1176127 RepID=A0A6A6BH10_9PEZI|nr:uncharacterized protein K452DRAFT_9699 [Aplosporella prunicola CBS 121167]KAF2142723.1 hypothetical protein K452DRAFT_9699 [Aplosporella prunicola CBS 121167]
MPKPRPTHHTATHDSYFAVHYICTTPSSSPSNRPHVALEMAHPTTPLLKTVGIPRTSPPHPLDALIQAPRGGVISVERRDAGRLYLVARVQHGAERKLRAQCARARGSVWLEHALEGTYVVARVPKSMRAAALAEAAADGAASVDIAEAEMAAVVREVRWWVGCWEGRGGVPVAVSAAALDEVQGCGRRDGAVASAAVRRDSRRRLAEPAKSAQQLSHPLPPLPDPASSLPQHATGSLPPHPLPPLPRKRGCGASGCARSSVNGDCSRERHPSRSVRVDWATEQPSKIMTEAKSTQAVEASKDDDNLRRPSTSIQTKRNEGPPTQSKAFPVFDASNWESLRNADPSLPSYSRVEAFGPSDTRDTDIWIGAQATTVVQLSAQVLADSVRYFAYPLRRDGRFKIADEPAPRFALLLTVVVSSGRLVVEPATAWQRRAAEVAAAEDTAQTQALGRAFLELVRSVHDEDMRDVAHVHANMRLLDERFRCPTTIAKCLQRAELGQPRALACAVVVDAVKFLAFGKRFASRFVFKQAFEALARRARVSKDVEAYLGGVPESVRAEMRTEVERMKKERDCKEQWPIAWEKME